MKCADKIKDHDKICTSFFLALLTLALIVLFANSWPPGGIVEHVHAVLAIVAHGVVLAITSAVHHSSDIFMFGQLGQTSLCVAVARAVGRSLENFVN